MRIEYHPAIETELVEIQRYYEEQSPGLGRQFIDEFERQVMALAATPERWMVVTGDLRRCLFGRMDQRVAEATIEKLFYLDGKSHDPIDLYIQSPGDTAQESLAIEHVVRILKSPVNTWTLTGCNSGGALLLASGTGKRRAFRGAVIMLHGLTWHGNPPSEYSKPIQDDYMQLWRKRARLPDSWLPFPFGVIHILSAEQALEYGVVDEVIDR